MTVSGLTNQLGSLMSSAAALLIVGSGCPALAATDVNANEYLDLDITQLMHITVSSVAKRDQRLVDAAAAVFVISQEDIRRSGVTSVADALAMAPGIQVAQISASKWSVSSRGFAGYLSNKLLVLIDGRSVYSPLYSGVFWDSNNVMLEDVERIEVVRGPGGTVWGANAVNGVVNIITKKAEDTQGGLIRVGVGDRESLTTAARYGGRLSETASGRFYAMMDTFGSNSLAGSGADANDGWQPLQAGFRVDGNPAGNKEWTLQGDLYKNSGDQKIAPYWTSTSPFQLAIDEDVNVSGGNLLARWRQELTADSALTVQAYLDDTKRDELLFNWQYGTVDFDLQYETMLGQRQRLTLGGGYRSIESEISENFQIWAPDRHDALYSAFLQDEINLVRNSIWLTLGSKYEHNDYTGSEWQPSAKLLWKPGPDHSLWASASRAVVTPTVLQQDAQIVVGVIPSPFVTALSFTGTPGCEAEKLWAYEAGYRWQARSNLSFDLALFHNDYDDLFTVMPSATSPDILWVNGVSGANQGLELSVDWQATSRLSFFLAYAYLDAHLSADDWVASEFASERYNQGSPQHQVSLRTSIHLADNWRLNLWGRHIDRATTWDQSQQPWLAIEIDDYFLFDANLVWTPNRHLELMLAGQNLVNSGQLQYRSEYSTPATEIERGVYGKLTWRF